MPLSSANNNPPKSGELALALFFALVLNLCVSFESSFHISMPQGFPLKAALLLTPLGAAWNLMPSAEQSFSFVLLRPAIRDGFSLLNSHTLLATVVALQLVAFYGLRLLFKVTARK